MNSPFAIKNTKTVGPITRTVCLHTDLLAIRVTWVDETEMERENIVEFGSLSSITGTVEEEWDRLRNWFFDFDTPRGLIFNNERVGKRFQWQVGSDPDHKRWVASAWLPLRLDVEIPHDIIEVVEAAIEGKNGIV
jgi:hypothetical protein